MGHGVVRRPFAGWNGSHAYLPRYLRPRSDCESRARRSSCNQAIAAPVVRLSRRQVPQARASRPSATPRVCILVRSRWPFRGSQDPVSVVALLSKATAKAAPASPLSVGLCRSLTSYNIQFATRVIPIAPSLHRSIAPSFHHPSGRPPLIIPSFSLLLSSALDASIASVASITCRPQSLPRIPPSPHRLQFNALPAASRLSSRLLHPHLAFVINPDSPDSPGSCTIPDTPRDPARLRRSTSR